MTSRTAKAVTIADYDPSWPRRFEEERRLILRACGEGAFVAIEAEARAERVVRSGQGRAAGT